MWLLPSLALALAVAHPQEDPEARPEGRDRYLGRDVARTMHWRGAPWLLRETREDEENGALLRRWLDVEPGQSVCDLGCGNGYHTLPLAEAVGPEGEVFAVDLQPEMLELLLERAEERQLANLVTVEATVDDPRLPPASVDMVLMVDVYHELSHPVRVLGHVRRALKEGGRVVLVEFRSEDRAVPIKLRHKMSKAQVIREMAANGFRLQDETDELPWQHVMAFEVAPEGDARLGPREVARGFVDAASGDDPRILLPYLASRVERGGDAPVGARELTLALSDAMRAGEPPVAPGSRVELAGAGDGRVRAWLEAPAGAAAGNAELLLGRDGDGRWLVEGWWSGSRDGVAPPFAAMHTGLGGLAPAEAAALLAELGYDGVACGPGGAAALRAACEPLGLDVWSSYATLDLRADLAPQLVAVEAEMEALRGGPGAIWLAIDAKGAPDDGTELDATAQRALTHLAAAADATGVEVALYPHTGFWLATTEQAIALAEATDSPRVGLCFNLCHHLRRDDAPALGALLERAAPWLRSVTVNGADASGTSWETLIQPLDAGDHDLDALLERLEDLDFEGTFGLQAYGIDLPPRVHLARSMEAWLAARR